MATISSSQITGSSLDVNSIVSQLMGVERQPVDKIDAKIVASEVKISVLAQFKSDASALQSALEDLADTTGYRSVVSHTAPTVAAVTASGVATAGRYQLQVAQTAEADAFNLSGFSSANSDLSGQKIVVTVAGVDYTYADDGSMTTTLETIRDWINQTSGLKDAVSATVLRAADGDYVLSLQGLKTGLANGFTVQYDKADANGLVTQAPRSPGAQDAIFTINGVQFTRPDNLVTDAISGLSLNLLSSSTSTSVIEVGAPDESVARTKLQAVVDAYNNLQSLYKEQSASSADPAARGLFSGDFAVSSMMRQLQSGWIKGLVDTSGQAITSDGSPLYLDAIGLELTQSGQIQLSETLLGRSTDWVSLLAQGVRVGFDASASKDLPQQISDMLDSSGSLYERMQAETQTQQQLVDKKSELEDRLIEVEQRYRNQYAALDALLYKLNNTSDALKSALDALTNSQKNG